MSENSVDQLAVAMLYRTSVAVRVAPGAVE